MFRITIFTNVGEKVFFTETKTDSAQVAANKLVWALDIPVTEDTLSKYLETDETGSPIAYPVNLPTDTENWPAYLIFEHIQE